MLCKAFAPLDYLTTPRITPFTWRQSATRELRFRTSEYLSITFKLLSTFKLKRSRWFHIGLGNNYVSGLFLSGVFSLVFRIPLNHCWISLHTPDCHRNYYHVNNFVALTETVEVGCLRHPGATTIGNQLQDGDRTDGCRNLTTQPWAPTP